MPGPRTLSQKSSLSSVRAHVAFTLRRLEGHPLAAPLAPTFKGLLDAWPALLQTELDLHDAIDDAQVAVVVADDKLNPFADRVSKEVLTLTSEDRTHPLYRHYFGARALNLFKRPMLGGQLEAMRAWPASLAGSEAPALKALGAELLPVIAEADEAAKAKGEAEQARDAFRDIDARKRYIDRVNAARKEAYGALAKLPHQHLGLSSSFADGFFRREAVKGEAAEEVTAAQVGEELEALRAQVVEKEALLKALEEKEKAEAAKAASRAAGEARLAALEAEVAAKKREAEALRAQLN